MAHATLYYTDVALHLPGWLISVLKQNFLDVRGFGIVLSTILFGFAFCFRIVFGDVSGACAFELNEQGALIEECDVDPYRNIGRAFLSTFELAVVGSYEPGIFDESQYTVLSVVLFVAAVMCVLVVVLNALIAVLSDSYARVQTDATANRRRERAEVCLWCGTHSFLVLPYSFPCCTSL